MVGIIIKGAIFEKGLEGDNKFEVSTSCVN